MRLYVNTKEVPFLKSALRAAINGSFDASERERYFTLLKRVELCEDLQDSERRAKKEEQGGN